MVSASVPGLDGLTLAAGHSQDSNDVAGTVEDKEMTMGARYTMGNVTAGYQVSEIQSGTAGAAGYNGTFYGVAVNVNENFSVSYNIADLEVDNPSSTECNRRVYWYICCLLNGISVCKIVTQRS